MTCPKCQAAMRRYERNGVHVDQCQECRGIFLDRGELERLVDAESSWHAQPPAGGNQPPAGGNQPPAGGNQPPASSQDRAAPGLGAIVSEVMQQVKTQKQGGHSPQQGQGYPRRKKKESFLGELFG